MKIGKILLGAFFLCLLASSFVIGRYTATTQYQKQFIALATVNESRNKQIKSLKADLKKAKTAQASSNDSTTNTDYVSTWQNATSQEKAAWALYTAGAYNQGTSLRNALNGAINGATSVIPMDDNSGTINIVNDSKSMTVYYKYDTTNNKLMFQYGTQAIQSVSFKTVYSDVKSKTPLSPVETSMFTEKSVKTLASKITLGTSQASSTSESSSSSSSSN